MSVIKKLSHWTISSLIVLSLTGCHPSSYEMDPKIPYSISEIRLDSRPSAFQELTEEERASEWGKELVIAERFGREVDPYRAITGYKRALFLLPPHEVQRRLQIQYNIVQSYYIGKKYSEVIHYFETSELVSVQSNFPALRDLLVMLVDSYRKMGECEQANCLSEILEKGDSEVVQELNLYQSLDIADICGIRTYSVGHPHSEAIDNFVNCYCVRAKSIRRAQTLNAMLPGAGYYYVGQRRTAVTAFLVNATFIYTAAWFFNKGNIGAGIITSSLELGWYLGGINGAGLAAKQYNERLYSCTAREMMVRHDLFPVLMLGTTF